MRPGLAELSKATKESAAAAQARRERTQARVGLASNAVGLAAGGAATVTATREYTNARRLKAGRPAAPESKSALARMARKVKAKHAVGLAGAGLLLQGTNVGGDLVANRVLARSAKEPASKRLEPHTKRGLQIVGAGGVIGLATAAKPETIDGKVDPDHPHHKRRKRVRKDDTMTGDSYSDIYESEGRGDGRGHSLTSIEKAATIRTPQMMLGTELPDEEIMKRARRYDPEADRQRRTGLYAGLGAGGAAAAGSHAAPRLAELYDSKTRKLTIPKLKGKSRGRTGLGLAALAAASGAGGAGAYRHGVSRRNQPYN